MSETEKLRAALKIALDAFNEINSEMFPSREIIEEIERAESQIRALLYSYSEVWRLNEASGKV